MGINRQVDDQLSNEPEANTGGELVPFPGNTTLDIPPSDVLEGALEQGLEDVIVIGFKEDGALYLASSSGDLLRILGTLNMAKFTYLMSSEG